MTILIYLTIVCFTAIQSSSTKLYSTTNDDSVSFNMIKTLSAFLLFAIIGLGGISFHTGTVIYGIAYGILLTVSMHCGYMSLALGPMSLTSMIVSFSVIIPIVFGVSFLNEKLNAFKMIGMALFIVSIVFANAKKPSTGMKDKKKWAFFLAATFVCNGFCSVIQKIHQIKYNSMYCFEFTLFAMLVCCVVFLVPGIKKHPIKSGMKTQEGIFAAISGITNALVGYFTLKLAGFENASVLFPAISAGTILCSLILGITLFKEKLKSNHIVAVISGIAAVVLLKL